MGRTRVERAETLAGALRVAGAPTELHIFPDVGHAINEEIRAEVAAFAARDREAGPSQPPRQPRGERSARP
jgi:acetyl esterase/lipase